MQDIYQPYTYPHMKEQYEDYLNRDLYLDNDFQPSISLYKNVILLPHNKNNPYGRLGLGGVIDNEGRIIDDSLIKGSGNHLRWGGRYDINGSPGELRGEYIYLGPLLNHWGHFLVDVLPRFHIIHKYPHQKFIMAGYKDTPPKNYLPQITRSLELCGLNSGNLLICSKPVKVERLYIPKPCYRTLTYYSPQFIKMLNRVIDNISPSATRPIDNIVFSKAKFDRVGNHIGIQDLDKTFEKNGYKIFYPENESIDNQIFYITHCKNFVALEGSMIHNLIFAKQKPNVILLKKTSQLKHELIDSCKIRGITPLIIDCYHDIFEVDYSYGPFWLICDNFLKKYFSDHGGSYIPILPLPKKLAQIMQYVKKWHNLSHENSPAIYHLNTLEKMVPNETFIKEYNSTFDNFISYRNLIKLVTEGSISHYINYAESLLSCRT